MNITTVSSREFNHDVSKVKKASLRGPVFITDRGQPAHVLLAIEDYRKLTATKKSIIDLLALPDADEIDFDPPKLKNGIFKSAEFD